MSAQQERSQRDIVHVRLPAGMRDVLKIRAIHNQRTLTAEVVYLIERGKAAVDANEKAADERQLADR